MVQRCNINFTASFILCTGPILKFTSSEVLKKIGTKFYDIWEYVCIVTCTEYCVTKDRFQIDYQIYLLHLSS
jgi:hypothetical protein